MRRRERGVALVEYVLVAALVAAAALYVLPLVGNPFGGLGPQVERRLGEGRGQLKAELGLVFEGESPIPDLGRPDGDDGDEPRPRAKAKERKKRRRWRD